MAPEQVWRHHRGPVRDDDHAALDEAAILDLTQTIDAAERPVIWAGVGVLRRKLGDAVIDLAERIGAPVVESVMGKGAVPERHPLVLGVYSGTTSAEPIRALVEDADLVIEMGLVENDITEILSCEKYLNLSESAPLCAATACALNSDNSW